MENLTEQIIKAESEIEQAIYQLDRLEDILETICQEIKSYLGFDFASISLVSLERRTIEAVHGIGRAKEWTGRSKHYLEKDEELRDIQADIVQTLRTKVISGWHKRFDRWLYEEFDHDQIVRVYTPLLVVQDRNGKIIKNWFKTCHWSNISKRTNSDGTCMLYEGLSFPDDLDIIAIGTIEAGYKNFDREITHDKVEELVDFLSNRAVDIWKAQLSWVLNIITEKAREFMNGSSATLHFLYEKENNQYIYQGFSGKIGWHLLRDCPPRKEGIGREAIRRKKHQFIPDASKGHSQDEIQKLNPEAFKAGIKALAAFPLVIDSDTTSNTDYKSNLKIKNSIDSRDDFSSQTEVINREGVLYIAFNQERAFTEKDISWLHLFASRAANAIRHATMYEQRREREQLLTTLHSVAQSLADLPNKKDLLRRIAWNTLNILGADIVTLYEYIQAENRFITLNDRAGRFKEEWKISDIIQENSAPAKLVKEQGNVYLSSIDENPIYQGSNFADQECIKSFAGVRLKIGDEIVGVMFINYRRSHYFTKDEKMIIETLSSSAAIAIKNQRWLSARSEIDRKIITTLNRSELLYLIADQAKNLTRANFSSIHLVHSDQSGLRLITEAQYPKSLATLTNFETSSIDEGITGWVARNRETLLINDVKDKIWNKIYEGHHSNIESALCVPLLNKDRKLLGVLKVESNQTKAFDQKHQQMLEALSDQAVIGILNIENKDRLVQMEAMATLGQLTAFMTHSINNDVGAIRINAAKLQNQLRLNGCENEYLTKIYKLANQMLQEVKRYRGFIQGSSQPVNLIQAIDIACSKTALPANVVLTNPELKVTEVMVLGNEYTLIMVLDNLLSNALDSMPRKGGEVKISLNILESLGLDNESWIEIRVCDTGKGIAKKHIGKIFELGYTTKTIAPGKGWGLWLTNNYIKSLGGNLTVESQINIGTVFSIKLPVYVPRKNS